MRIEKQCKICGRVFQARQSNYLCCSAECRRENERQLHKGYYDSGKYTFSKIKYTKPKKIYYCCECGCQLPDGRQKTCLDCLLREYQNSRKERPMKLLANRGFDKAAILYEIELRGA
jgi:hypothetical protein